MENKNEKNQIINKDKDKDVDISCKSSNVNKNNDTGIRDNIQDFLGKENCEPDILLFLNTEPECKEGLEILRKCIGFFFEKNWETLIDYLEMEGKRYFYFVIFSKN